MKRGGVMTDLRDWECPRGWECPKCGKCFAPWVSECSECKGHYNYLLQRQPEFPLWPEE